MNSKFWSQDPSILLSNLVDFFPSRKMNNSEKLNAIVRLSAYIAIALMLLKGALWPIYILLIALGGTLFIFMNASPETFDEIFDLPDDEIIDEFGERCTLPTVQNPYMNVTIDEIQDDPERAPACSPLNPMIAGQIEDKFSHNLYRDVDDIFSRDASLNFWTNPSTTIPNDQHKLAMWLYGDMPSCKEDTANCLRYVDARQSRQDFVDPVTGRTINPIGN